MNNQFDHIFKPLEKEIEFMELAKQAEAFAYKVYNQTLIHILLDHRCSNCKLMQKNNWCEEMKKIVDLDYICLGYIKNEKKECNLM